MNGRDNSRAERFEDEKRRIIDSCFAKRDEDGSGERQLIPRPLPLTASAKRNLTD